MFEVFIKEIKELLRDKKTLFFVVALPMAIFPIIFALIGFLMTKAAVEAEQKVHTYAIANEVYAQSFADEIFYHKSFKKADKVYATVDEMVAAVKSGEIDVGIYIEKDARAALKEGEQSKWQIVFNDSQQINFIFNRIKESSQEFAKKLQGEVFSEYGLSEEKQKAVLNPIKVEKVDTADKRENIGEKLGGFIPYLLIPIVLVGAMYPAIDIGAGEKERGTLETLLLTPVTRTELVLGKFFTVMAASLATALITVTSMGVWMSIAGAFFPVEKLTDAFSSLNFIDFSLILLLLIPVACAFSAVVLAISIYARSYKEAQNYMSPISMLAFLPVLVAMMPNMELTLTTAMIPVTNVALAIKEIIKGTVDYTMIGAIFIATVVLAGALIAACAHWFKQESVLFR